MCDFWKNVHLCVHHVFQAWNKELQQEYDQRHDTSTAALVVDLDKCIKCGRCVTACNLVQVC